MLRRPRYLHHLMNSFPLFQVFTVLSLTKQLFLLWSSLENRFCRVSLVFAVLVNYTPSFATSDLMETSECVVQGLFLCGGAQRRGHRPPWWRQWSKSHMVLCICSCWQEDIVPFFSLSLSCFNQSAMAYMVCRGPKIRRRKLNNVFLFFKGRAMVGWL